jgi:hypothetical protein
MGSKSSGLSPAVQQGELANSTALTQLAQQQAGNATQLFQSAFPGFQQAENFYGDLSTGDPSAIARAISPATQQIGAATAGAKANILNNAPAGGERNLAIEQADVNQGAQVGSTATSGYLNSFNALAQLAGQGVGQSTAAAGAGTSAYGTANQGLGQLGNQQIEQKGAQLGAVGSLAGSLSSGLATAF